MDDKQLQWAFATLAKIEKHLNSIKNILIFFLVVVILAILLQACSALLTLRV